MSLIIFFNPTIYILIKKLIKIFFFLIQKKLIFNKKKNILDFASNLIIQKYFKSKQLNYLIKNICVQNINKNINYKFHSNLKRLLYTKYLILNLFYKSVKNKNIQFFYKQNLKFSFFKGTKLKHIKKQHFNKANKKLLSYSCLKNKNIKKSCLQYSIKEKLLISFFIYYPITTFLSMKILYFEFFILNKRLKNLLRKKQNEKLNTILMFKTKIIKKKKKYYQITKKSFINIYFYLVKLQQNKFILFWKKISYYILFSYFNLVFKHEKVIFNLLIKKSKQTFFLKKKKIKMLKAQYKLKNVKKLKNSYLQLNKKTFGFIKKPFFFYKTKGFFILIRQYKFKQIFFNCLKNEFYKQIIKNQTKLFYKKRLIIIRPLLKINRKNIFLFAKKLNLIIYFDPTNKNLIFTRNYIRYQILPLLKKINPKIEKNIYKFSQITYLYYKKLKLLYLNNIKKF